MFLKMIRSLCVVALVLGAGMVQADPLDIAVDGSFESGNLDSWVLFPTADGQIVLTSPGSEGDYAVCITNTVNPSAAIIKNANIGIGVVEAGQAVTISFDAKGTFGVGGVAFAEFFSELDGGGVSASEILGGGPLGINPDTWTSFSFETVTGPDVSGGVTVQFTATTGADPASSAQVYYDNLQVIIDVTVADEPSTMDSVKALYR